MSLIQPVGGPNQVLWWNTWENGTCEDPRQSHISIDLDSCWMDDEGNFHKYSVDEDDTSFINDKFWYAVDGDCLGTSEHSSKIKLNTCREAPDQGYSETYVLGGGAAYNFL